MIGSGHEDTVRAMILNIPVSNRSLRTLMDNTEIDDVMVKVTTATIQEMANLLTNPAADPEFASWAQAREHLCAHSIKSAKAGFNFSQSRYAAQLL